jgi:hypothetical protein
MGEPLLELADARAGSCYWITPIAQSTRCLRADTMMTIAAVRLDPPAQKADHHGIDVLQGEDGGGSQAGAITK